MAYTALSKRVADVMQQRAAAQHTPPPTQKETEHAVAALQKEAAKESPPPSFTWDTPERTRQMVHNQIAPAKKPAARGMSNQQIIRELRKLKRAQ